ncbi:hypothetical protein G3A_02755 [Bacillus sp. 17376]|nr:hypothetical protein G3A_02755 [Bacillus sp. 17376]
MPKLLRVVQPNTTENIYSFINRLTEENKYEANTWILKQAHIPNYYGPRNLLPWNFNFKHLIELTGLDLEQIGSLTFQKEFGYEGKEYELFNHLLYKEALMGKTCKVCPKCINEFGQNHKLWDIRFLLICPIHKNLLMSHCPSCKKAIPQYRRNFYKCACSSDIRTFYSKPVTNIESLTLPNIIYSKFSNNLENVNSKNPLYLLELKYILLVYIFFIKLFYRDKTKVGSTAIPYNPEDQELSGLLISISSIFNDWPNSFYDFIYDYQDKPKSKPKYDRGSLINNFGYFYIDLYKKYNHPSLNFLREEFENYIHNNWDKTIISHGKYINKDPMGARYLSTTQVAKMLNIQHKHVRNLIRNGHLKAIKTRERNDYLLILRDSVEEYISNQKLFSNREQVKQILNVGYQSITELERRGLLILKRGPNIDGHFEYLYDKEKIHQLLSKIESRYYQYKRRSLDNISSYEKSDVVKCTKYVIGINIADILSLIIEGRILPVGKIDKEKGIKKYLLQISTVKQEVLEYKIRSQQGVFSIPELMNYLEIGKNLLNRLIENGFLAPTNKMQKPFIPVENAISFKSNYITLGQLSAICSEESHDLLDRLSYKGINPILDSFVKKNIVYSIEDIQYLIK